MTKPSMYRAGPTAIALMISASAGAHDRYRVVVLPGFHPESINDAGEIAGTLTSSGSPPFTAAVWRNGTYEAIGTVSPNLPTSQAEGINNNGTVVGHGNSPGPGGEFPFIWDGKTMPLDPIYAEGTLPLDINDVGDVVGQLTDGGMLRAFLWQAGKATILSTLPAEGDTIALDTNNLGQIVGWSIAAEKSGWLSGYHGVIWENGVINDLSLARNLKSIAYDINELSQIVGSAEQPDGLIRATIWNWRTGEVINLGTLPGHGPSFGRAINNHSQVIGDCLRGGFEAFRCFFWENGQIMRFNDLLVHDPGWTFRNGIDINNAGQIIGEGSLPGSPGTFLLTPVDDADLDADGTIDSIDLTALLSSWSIPVGAPACGGSTPCLADINGDGVVDTIDLGILLSRWTL